MINLTSTLEIKRKAAGVAVAEVAVVAALAEQTLRLPLRRGRTMASFGVGAVFPALAALFAPIFPEIVSSSSAAASAPTMTVSIRPIRVWLICATNTGAVIRTIHR